MSSATTTDLTLIAESRRQGAVFTLFRDGQRHGRGEQAWCEFRERDQRQAEQPCNREGARYMLMMTFANGTALSRHICTNHAARTAAHLGMPFPPELSSAG